MSADIKSAFLKGEEFQPGERELYIQNIKVSDAAEPQLPLGDGGLARLRKGIFGLADSPRRWYLRLHKSLTNLGWERSSLDAAMWMLWSADRTKLDGLLVSHVDDLLLGGNERAKALLLKLGDELGYGSLEEKRFHYCGKLIEQHDNGDISISMREYHENLKPIIIPVHRRRGPTSPLLEYELKSLRALLGSLQWLVAQVRFDMSYLLCTLQGEITHATVGTMMRANGLLRRFKQDPGFSLWFRAINLEGCGLMGISDASLGNVELNGSAGENPMSKVYSQAAYIILIADKDLMAGHPGKFTVLDARSHRLARVCRSTFAAELLGVEETFDTGLFCRGSLAECLGFPMEKPMVESSIDAVPLCVVTDAKDTYDKSMSDTPSFGSQKSLAFTISWLRATLRRPNVSLRWTSTENMITDPMTKDMDGSHLRKVIQSGEWCVKYHSSFVKQTSKTPKSGSVVDEIKVGRPVSSDDPLLGRLQRFSEKPGWHEEDSVVIHVARSAKAFRTPKPRYDPKLYDLRSSYGRFDLSNGSTEWRELEKPVSYMDLPRRTGMIGQVAACLVTFFRQSSQINKRIGLAVEDCLSHG